MPRIFSAPPDPRIQVFNDYVSNLQIERRRREDERAASREAKKKRQVTIPTTVIGAVLGGVGAAAGGAAAGGIASGALTGGAIGARAGEQFAGGDFAGGLGTAAMGAQRLMQGMEDRQLYGGSVTRETRQTVANEFAELGINPVEAKQVALGANISIFDVLETARLELGTEEEFSKLAADAGMTSAHLNQLGENHPLGRMGALQDARGQRAEFEAEAAGMRAANVKYQTLKAEVSMAGRLEEMEGHRAPRDLAGYDHKIEDVKELWLAGDLSSEQAIERFGTVGPLPRKTITPRLKPPTVAERVDKDLKVHQFRMPDGSLSPPAIVRFHAPTPRSPHGETEFVRFVDDGKGPAIAFGAALAQLPLPVRQKMMEGAGQQLILEGIRNPTAQQKLERLEANFGTMQDRIERGDQPAVPGGQPGQPGQGAQLPPVQRAAQVADGLIQAARQKPIDTWTDQELSLAGASIDRAQLDLERSGLTDPAVLKELDRLIEISKAINAQRNR